MLAGLLGVEVQRRTYQVRCGNIESTNGESHLGLPSRVPKSLSESLPVDDAMPTRPASVLSYRGGLLTPTPQNGEQPISGSWQISMKILLPREQHASLSHDVISASNRAG